MRPVKMELGLPAAEVIAQQRAAIMPRARQVVVHSVSFSGLGRRAGAAAGNRA